MGKTLSTALVFFFNNSRSILKNVESILDLIQITEMQTVKYTQGCVKKTQGSHKHFG